MNKLKIGKYEIQVKEQEELENFQNQIDSLFILSKLTDYKVDINKIFLGVSCSMYLNGLLQIKITFLKDQASHNLCEIRCRLYKEGLVDRYIELKNLKDAVDYFQKIQDSITWEDKSNVFA